MGRTPQPLVILYAPTLAHPSLDALAEKGHTVRAIELEADILLASYAHYWDATMMETAYLEAALKAARKRRKGEA